MTDRDDYPDSPYRGHPDRQGGYDYDPLSDPLPAQPPSRGRRARPEPEQGPWNDPVGAGDFQHAGPLSERPSPPGRRRRAQPFEDTADERSATPPRRFGAADALRGSRAARSGRTRREAPRPAPQAPGEHQRSGVDSTQAALDALTNLAGAPTEPGRGRAETDQRASEPPHTGRRARTDDGPEARSPFWGDEEEGPTPAFFADEPDDEPKGRRSRRQRAKEERGRSRETGAFEAVSEERSTERRGRRRARRGAQEEDTDAGSFAFEGSETGAFAEPEPRGRRGGRRRRGAGDEPAPASDRAREENQDSAAFPSVSDPGGEEEGSSDTGAFPLPGEEEPVRGRRRARRSRRSKPEPIEETVDEEPEGDEYEEASLEEIAASYGDSRANRKRLKAAKKARAKREEAARGGSRRRGNKGLMILLALVLMLVIAGGGFAVMRTYLFPSDFDGTGSGEVIVVIEEGQSGTAVAQTLVDQGVVASTRSFTNALGRQGQSVVPGTYALAEGMSGEAAVAALSDPANRVGGRVTIREGLRGDQILEQLAENTGVSLEELQEAYAMTDELGLPEYATEGPEGYLFPSTYRFEPETEALSMLRTMVTQHRQLTESIDLEGRAEALGYDANEVMAIASIVQAESGGVDDMAKISRVVHNRLEIDMPLQMDSTCFYAIGEYGIALNNDQLAACEADTSGFDTYHRTGLIPGPFVAPGEDALEAALEPEEGDWLYFVATDPENGVTEFAETHEEFEVLKERFQETWGGGGN
ncbi:endolytic transglycosylase MltG [Nocardiopsis alkaliphila]|uniref:endolytic transglycosylase MltG n=1 Tax=Nocardiopsis alkaliphila TaxID=225762 RepID=UPI00034D2138|nr:endolytic transglycosylase MltG [Nocardiopsis alkaliphila]